MIDAHQLTPALKQLRLSGILDTLEVRTQQAIQEQWSYVDFLARLVQDEVERRRQKQLGLVLRRGNVNTTKTLEAFDFGFNPSVNRQQVFDLGTCGYIRQHRNALIVGQTGTGKTHLAHALAHEAARQGFDVLFTGAHQMLLHINAGRADGSYPQRLASYVRPDLLVLDDFGLKGTQGDSVALGTSLKPLPPSGPVDFYDVVNERYERGSILLTSNRAPAEWQEVWGDPLLASAGLDRLGHSATVLTITGKSYRLAHHELKEAPPVPHP